jgi:hypothetical protein
VKLFFEFLTVFRQMTGLESLSIQLAGGPDATVAEALHALERALAQAHAQAAVPGELRLLQAGRVAAGVLIFRRTPTGALERVRNPEDQAIVEGEHLVLSVAMAGG